MRVFDQVIMEVNGKVHYKLIKFEPLANREQRLHARARDEINHSCDRLSDDSVQNPFNFCDVLRVTAL